MKTKTIKNVDERTWEILKRLAKKKKVKMGTLLRHMTSEYKKLESIDLKKLVPERPILSGEEAEQLQNAVKDIRSEYGFR